MPKERDIIFTPILKQELVLITPKNHPLTNRKEVHLIETIAFPQIMLLKTTSMRHTIDDLFSKTGEEPQIVYELEDEATIAGFVSNNQGIGIVTNTPMLDILDVRVIKIIPNGGERIFEFA